MKCTSFTEEQIIGILKEAEAGTKAGAEATVYHWKAQCGGLEV